MFPEVFGANRPGFDAIIGNPPFLGGSKISGSTGSAYREYLVSVIANGIRGNADLIAYFLLRAHTLINSGGQTGLIATNTLAQGDTREVGLDQVVALGTEIRRAIKSKPWPSKSVVLEYAAIWTSRHSLDAAAERRVEEVSVARISPALVAESRVSGNPQKLIANAGMAFEGTKIYGSGFILSPDRASELIKQDKRNSEVIFPYLGGQDLNSDPTCRASRWVINFHDWPEGKAKAYLDCYNQIHSLVRPERQRLKPGNAAREHWWQYERRRPELYNSIRGFRKIIVIPRVTKYISFAFVPNGQIYDTRLVILASDSRALFCVLSSSIHQEWALAHGTTHESRPTYFPSQCFETFPRLHETTVTNDLGERLETFRQDLMASRQAGLTATYNLVHAPKCVDSDIVELRDIHRAIDVTVVGAYGWDDLVDSLDHGFYETRQGIRYTVAAGPRQEILDRLLELNHARYADEVKVGQRAKKPIRKRPSNESEGLQTLPDM